MFRFLSLLACLFVSLAHATGEFEAVLGLHDDPTQFFGGENHDSYLEWLNSDRSSAFDCQVFFQNPAEPDHSLGTALHWSIVDDKWIRLAIIVRAQGWVGLGLSENGGMRGADMVIFEARNPTQLVDAHVLDDLNPIVDSCQNWELNYSDVTDDGFMIVEATRLLDTGDTQDHRIYDDSQLAAIPHRVISAWGDSETWSYHGRNVAKRDILFHGGSDVASVFKKTMAEEAEGSFVIAAQDFLIPAQETRYKDFCFDADFFEAQGVPMDKSLHVIGIEPIIDPRTTKYVHHFTIRSSEGNTCATGQPYESVYGWSPGVGPELFPSFLGSPLGVDGFMYYSMQIHYNNPDEDEGHLDSSGIRVYWTSKKREMDVGTFGFADPLLSLNRQPVGVGLSKHEFSCPSSCSSLVLSIDEPVTGKFNIRVISEVCAIILLVSHHPSPCFSHSHWI